MARIPLIGETDHPELSALIAHLKAARGGKLINLYRLLLNSPAIASAWLDFNSAVRFDTALDAGVRELIILRVSILNGADYQVRIHGAAYAGKAGLSGEQVAALANWRKNPDLFNPLQRAVLAYVDAMTKSIEVVDAIYDEFARHFNPQQILEVTVLTGAYNMHTRVARALQLDIEPGAQK
jgi:AhpD family alkylhydroperoxidase